MKVSFFGNVLDYTDGEKFVELSGAESLRALIDQLVERYSEPFRDFLLGDETCFFLVNGGGIMATGGLATQLNAGDSIEVLPFVDGG